MTPYIISASRREDIPAFKTDWLLERIKEGKVEMCSLLNMKFLLKKLS